MHRRSEGRRPYPAAPGPRCRIPRFRPRGGRPRFPRGGGRSPLRFASPTV